MRVAVLGSGLSGSLAALALAERGCSVDLFDARAAPMEGASRNCEGKLHLGFVYALDQSHRTVETVMRGALTFRPIVRRYVEAATIEAAMSEPFVYAVMAGSMLPAAAIEAHFGRVAAAFEALGGRPDADYPGLDGEPVWRPLDRRERVALFDEAHVVAAYRTIERAIDPAPLADALVRALATAPGIALAMGARVETVERADAGGYLVRWRRDGLGHVERYDRVVNAAWEGRLALDRHVLPPPGRPVLHRYKAGFFGKTGEAAAAVPGASDRRTPPASVTFVTGPYGDVVSYPGRVYLSWYPSCLISQERALAPGRPEPTLHGAPCARILGETKAALGRLMPRFAPLFDETVVWRPVGGYITSWGERGIDDPASELHERYRIGPGGTPTYQSIDTGKFTTAPLHAVQAVAAVTTAGKVAEEAG